MQSRFVATLLVALSLCVSAAVAHAQMYDPEGRYSGGNPRPRSGALFGMIGGYGGEGPVPRQTVNMPGNYAPGTIIVNTAERRLYLVQDGGTAMKKEWPDWTPPSQMLKRRPDLPRFMKGGPDNPLGARAMYLGSSLYRIHGSNEPETIGTAVSSGCFRLTNEDVIHLYERVRVGSKVIVLR
jgi:lipoprotein-anchoring transpeptidase ErfK/SrfK